MAKKILNKKIETSNEKLNMNNLVKKPLICQECGSNKAEKRVFQTGVDGGMRGVFCDNCWSEFCYEFMD